jgi:nitroreductase
VSLVSDAAPSSKSDATPSVLVARRSIRKYLSKQVPDEVVQNLLFEARWAPSASNTQSTYVYVLSGEPFTKFKADLRKNSEDNVTPQSDIDMKPQWTPRLEARMKEMFEIRSTWVAAQEKKAGIEQPATPVNPMVAGAAIFGAPILLVLAFDKAIGIYNGCFDAGLLAMAITVAAHERGLGTCVVGSAVRYSDLVRKHVPGLEDKNVVMGIALGYPDPAAFINKFPRTRALLKEWVIFVK